MSRYILLKNAFILTQNEQCDHYEHGDILIEDGRIASIGETGTLLLPDTLELTTKDCSGLLLMPGLVNAHSHSQSALTKMTRSGDRTNTITALWYGFGHGENRTASDIELSATVNAIQMLQSGCTLTIDQFNYGGTPTLEQVDAAVRGYEKSGMRALVVYDMIDCTQDYILPQADVDIPPLAKKLAGKKVASTLPELVRGFETAVSRCKARGNSRVTVIPGTPVPSMCTDELLRKIPKLSMQQGTVYTCHMLEHVKERQLTERRWHESELAHLEKLGFLTDRLNIAHCIWATDPEIQRLGQLGVSVTHCPELNIKLGGGVAKIRKMLNSGVNVALGADSATNQVLFDVMKLTALVHRIGKPNPKEWIFADEILSMATMGGARALGMADQVGSLETGKRADIIMLDLCSPWLCPTTDLDCRLVYTETGASVDTVMVDGDFLMEHGAIKTLNTRSVLKQAQEVSDQLYETNREIYDVADTMTAVLDPEIKDLLSGVTVDNFDA